MSDKPQTIKIDDVEYVRSDLAPKTNGDIRIVILQRGWVVVGKFSQDGTNCSLSNASVIRNWGSEKGLGQIAENGPATKTILDKSPLIRFHELSVVAMIDCVVEKWCKYV